VDLEAGARLLWREELVCGRHGEQPGDLRLAIAVRLDGSPLLRQELAVGPSAPGWSGPAVLGGARTAGSLLLVDPALPDAAATIRGDTACAARVPLTGPAVLVTATAADARHLRDALHALVPGVSVGTPY
jgi:urease accessory protein